MLFVLIKILSIVAKILITLSIITSRMYFIPVGYRIIRVINNIRLSKFNVLYTLRAFVRFTRFNGIYYNIKYRNAYYYVNNKKKKRKKKIKTSV